MEAHELNPQAAGKARFAAFAGRKKAGLARGTATPAVWWGAPDGFSLEAPARGQAMPPNLEGLDYEITARKRELATLRRSLQLKYDQLKLAEQVLSVTQSDAELACRLAMLGQMAKDVVHELSQPLSEIRTFARNADALVASGKTERATQNIARIADSGERMAAIIGQLKHFAKKGAEACAPLDLAKLIDASALLLQPELSRADTTLKVQVVDPVHAWANAARIEQVLITLLRNAVDAVEHCATRQLKVVLMQDGQQALVKVRDSGVGLSPDVAARLFEPFFTTKPWGKGLGLGLAIAASSVQAMGGTLQACGRPGEGAEFVLRLPLSPHAPEAA